MKLNFNDFKAVLWAPKDTSALIDKDNQFVRALVSKDMILIPSVDLGRLRGLKSNADNRIWRMWRDQESYRNKLLFKVSKKTFDDTSIVNFINTGQTILTEINVAKAIMSTSSKPGNKTAYKTFINGIYQKAIRQQSILRENDFYDNNFFAM